VTRIVLAEPNFILREALQRLLQELGAEVEAVRSADEAAQILATSSGMLLIDGSIAIEEHAVERFQHLQDLQVILVTVLGQTHRRARGHRSDRGRKCGPRRAVAGGSRGVSRLARRGKLTRTHPT
jgi:CheY-like chemotaxis protein